VRPGTRPNGAGVNAVIGLGALAGALLLVILRTLVADEVRGRIQRRVRQSVEHTIASLPEDLQAEWGTSGGPS
jgi:hypothetical protein